MARTAGVAVALTVAGCDAPSGAASGTGPGTPPTYSIQVSPSNLIMQIGSGMQFTAEARDSRDVVVPGAVFSWSSSNTSVVSIGGTGAATAEGAGHATVTASYAGSTGGTNVLVVQ